MKTMAFGGTRSWRESARSGGEGRAAAAGSKRAARLSIGRWLAAASWAVALWVCGGADAAQAQVGRGTLRLSLDTDLFSMAGVEINPDGPQDTYDVSVIGFGPGHLGGSHVPPGVAPMSQLGFGVGWGLSRRLVLGIRTGLGVDVIDPDGSDNELRVLAFSLAPGLTFVPLGRRAKLFLAFSPLFQANRLKTDNTRNRVLLGGFSTGVGALIFAGSSASVDLGFFFEGRFGGGEQDDGVDYHVRDLRGCIRLGISLWK